MTLKEKMKVRAIICRTARKFRITPKKCRKEMQKTIDEAWEKAWQPYNLQAQRKWQELFPGGNKPSVEEFILGLGKQLS